MKNKFLILILCTLVFVTGIKTSKNANKNFNYIVQNNTTINKLTNIIT